MMSLKAAHETDNWNANQHHAPNGQFLLLDGPFSDLWWAIFERGQTVKN